MLKENAHTHHTRTNERTRTQSHKNKRVAEYKIQRDRTGACRNMTRRFERPADILDFVLSSQQVGG